MIVSTIAFNSGSDRRFLRFFAAFFSNSEKSSARLFLLEDEVVLDGVDAKDSEEVLNPDNERRESVEVSLMPDDERDRFESLMPDDERDRFEFNSGVRNLDGC